MGLFDFLTGGGDPSKQIEKHRKKLTDRYRQSHERYEAMDALAKMGTPEAMRALMARFDVRVDGPTVDEDEKNYCFGLLRAAGADAVPTIEAYVASNTAVYFPLRALREIAGDERAVDALLQAMDDCDPGYHQGLERLREIVSNLRDFQHPRVLAALGKLATSRSDEIRFFALDGLAGYAIPEVVATFVDRLCNDESQRVRALACELAITHDLDFSEHAAALNGKLGEQYRLDERGRIQRRMG